MVAILYSNSDNYEIPMFKIIAVAVSYRKIATLETTQFLNKTDDESIRGLWN